MPNVNCDPTKGAVADSCGVFVSLEGDDMNPGTMEKPFKSMATAIMKAGKAAVYACDEEFAEGLSIDSGIAIYGGLDCKAKWAYVGKTKKTTIKAPVDSVAALVVKSPAKGLEIHDLHFETVKPSVAGASSIAVIVDGGESSLIDCEIVAGDGADGAPGAVQMQVAAGAKGDDGVDGMCTHSVEAGGAGGLGMCGPDDVGGGGGGNGTNNSVGGPGLDGLPSGGVSPDDGKGGAAQDSMNACKPGHIGGAGTPGQSGAGATGIGMLSATGYEAPVANLGMTPGTHGNGGGGGGGAKKCGNGNAGPSGGGGGAGGCGGAPGNAGGSAGSSIGLLALNATLTLSKTTIKTGAGGTGGVGGDGQAGGAGGPAGNAVGNACGGGKGGQGGRGGSGGGGLGGHSIGIAFLGTLPTGATISPPGMAGPGGGGGDMDMSAKGDSGLACTTLDFKAGAASCGK
jgi:hypothetical protein